METTVNDWKFYDWEFNSRWHLKYQKDELTLTDCKLLIEKIRKDYKHSQKIVVKDGRGSDFARCVECGTYDEIHLPRWARTLPTVLHEIAHSLAPKEKESHGPLFLATFAMLLEKYLGLDAVKVILSAKRHKLRIGPIVL